MTGTVALLLGSAQGGAQLLHETLGRRLRDELRTHGVAYVQVADARRAGADLAAVIADERAVVRSAAGACRTVVAVDEHDPSRPDRPDEVARAAGVSSLRVGLAVERQDRLVEHRWVDAVRAGDTTVADEQADAERVRDHAADVRALTGLACVHEVRVRPYELVGAGPVAWVDDTLAWLGLRDDLDLRPLLVGGHLPAYRSYSPTALALGRELQQEVGTSRGLELVHEFLLASFSTGVATADGTDGARLLDESLRQKVVVAHRDLNAAFFAEFLPDLPVGSYADDTATAQLADVLVPVRVAPMSPVRRARTIAGRATRDRLGRPHRVDRAREARR